MPRPGEGSKKFQLLAALAGLFLIAAAAPRASAQAAPARDAAAKAKAVVQSWMQDLKTGHMAAADARLTPAMKSAMKAKFGGMAGLLGKITAGAGPLQDFELLGARPAGPYENVLVRARFAKKDRRWLVTVGAAGEIGGLHFLPLPTPAAWTPPSYANPAKFHERALAVVDNRYTLPGTLTVPNGPGPFPAVVLVPGSGPNDRDETVGSQKPFKDLAWGLASRGIAVLRYDKRTRVYGADSGPTPAERTGADAHAAAELLMRQPEVRPKRVYLLGHSEGGYLAPWIAARTPGLAGIIILAGPSRDLLDSVAQQLQYLIPLQAPKNEVAADLARAREQIQAAKAPKLSPNQIYPVADVTFSGAYLLWGRQYHPAAVAAALRLPILVLQGARDYNVRKADFLGWKRALAGRDNARFRLYPGLEHLFSQAATPGNGLATPRDDVLPGHVAPEVIGDIAAWIQSGRLPPRPKSQLLLAEAQER